MIGALIGVLIPAASVWLTMQASGLGRVIGSRALLAALALGGGVGVASLTAFWFTTLAGGLRSGFVLADVSLWTVVGGVAWWRLRRAGTGQLDAPPDHPRHRLTTEDWLVRLLFAAVAAIAVATVATELLAYPHGEWDAWAIWNQKARFLFRGGNQWTDSLAIAWSNPSHPLLVPVSVARLWAYAGTELPAVPAMLGIVFGVAIVAAVMGALDLGRRRAWIAGAVLLAPGTFLHQITAQQADVPIAFFTVASLILLQYTWMEEGGASERTRPVFLAAGALCGLASWTKNEGLLLVAILAVLAAWSTLRRGRILQFTWWAGGAAVAVLTVAWFKLVLAPLSAVYLEETGTIETIVAQIAQPERRAAIHGLMWKHWVHWGGTMTQGTIPFMTLAGAAAAATRGGRAARVMLTVTALMIAGVYGVYLVTALDVTFLIATTLDRLLTQLWPVLVLAAFSGSSAEPSTVAASRQNESTRRSPASSGRRS